MVPIREPATLEHCDWLFKQVPAPEDYCGFFLGSRNGLPPVAFICGFPIQEQGV